MIVGYSYNFINVSIIYYLVVTIVFVGYVFKQIKNSDTMIKHLSLNDYDYDLPKELIAQSPADKRDQSRLLILNETTGVMSHKIFNDVIDYLKKDDILVINNTKVLEHKILGIKETGAPVELIIINEEDKDSCWCLVKTNKPRIGTIFLFGKKKTKAEIINKKDNLFLLRFDSDLALFIKENGLLPLPPYVKEPNKISPERYQTVFSKNPGSLAAPTAGLHFTNELLERIKKKGVTAAEVSLHVSYGTFLPIRSDNVLDHKMAPEYFEVTKKTADIINNRKGRLIVVGTTSLKCLESATDENGVVQPKAGWSELYITPAHKPRLKLDAMITNFHLPKSTLIILVCTFFDKEKIFTAYKEAIKEKYRFYSFGDAMMINK